MSTTSLPFQIDLVHQPREYHDHPSPLLRRQTAPIPHGRHQNAHKLAGGGDGRVSERTELTDGKEDEVLPNSTTQTEQ